MVSPAAIEQRLSAQAANRELDLADVRRGLAAPEAVAAMHALGADPADLRARVATLRDSDLQDLARRARALDVDSIGGVDVNWTKVTIGTVVVVIVIVLLEAIHWD